MRQKHLFFVVFIASLMLSGKFFFANSPYLASLMLLMALASALNASRPEADKKTHFKDIVNLFVEQK
mgnify:CR=1 FL=1